MDQNYPEFQFKALLWKAARCVFRDARFGHPAAFNAVAPLGLRMGRALGLYDMQLIISFLRMQSREHRFATKTADTMLVKWYSLKRQKVMPSAAWSRCAPWMGGRGLASTAHACPPAAPGPSSAHAIQVPMRWKGSMSQARPDLICHSTSLGAAGESSQWAVAVATLFHGWALFLCSGGCELSQFASETLSQQGLQCDMRPSVVVVAGCCGIVLIRLLLRRYVQTHVQ